MASSHFLQNRRDSHGNAGAISHVLAAAQLPYASIHSASVTLFSFFASMIVLAGPEWSARRPVKESTGVR